MTVDVAKNSTIVIFICLLGFSNLAAQSCETPNLTHYNFQDIKNILEKNNCQNCHNKDNTNNVPWHFNTYQDIIAKGKCGPIVVPGSPQTSLLVDKLNQGANACGYNMPLGGQPMPSRDLLAIENWILIGAPEFCIPSFTEVQDILSANQCQSCHQQANEWRFDSFDKIFAKTNQSRCPDPLIIPFNAHGSLLYRKISGEPVPCGDKMPVSGNSMSYLEVARIRDWINAGAFAASPSLPVELTDFFAEYVDEAVHLYWQSGAEYNTDYYLVEYSRDGISFDEIGVRDAGALPDQLTNYNFIDFTPGFGNQYYRLKIMDKDGQFSYSPTRAVRIKNTTETLKIYPSTLPANQTIYIEWLPAFEEERTKIHVLDILGREVFSHVIYPGVNATQIPPLLPGLYYAVIQHDVENYFIKKMIMIY